MCKINQESASQKGHKMESLCVWDDYIDNKDANSMNMPKTFLPSNFA